MVLQRIVLLAALGVCGTSLSAQAQDSVFLEELTWTEVRDAIQAGKTTVIIPTGGTEQNDPHMVLGKHNVRVKITAGEIAKRLGNALVAPPWPTCQKATSIHRLGTCDSRARSACRPNTSPRSSNTPLGV